MSKQRRTQGPTTADPEIAAVGPGVEGWEASNDLARSALAEGGETEAPSVRSDLERAVLALQIEEPPDSERLVEILEASNLPPDRVDALVDRLRAEAALAGEVAATVERWFGADSPEMRATLHDEFSAAIADPSSAPAPVVGVARQLALLAFFEEDEDESLLADYSAEEGA